MINHWKIEVLFIGEYRQLFTNKEEREKTDSEYRFALAIEFIMKELQIIPSIGDWIEPLAKPDYSLDIAKIVGRTFYPSKKRLVFEIA